MLLDTYFYHLPKALPSHTCEDIIKFGKSLNPKKAKTGSSKIMLSDEQKKEHVEEIRNSKTEWIRDSWLMREITPFVEYANKSWGFNISKYESVQFTEYQPKGHYNWHNDSMKNPMDLKNMQRKLSVSLQLSKPEDYDGGDLKFNLRGLDSYREDNILGPPPEFKQQGSIVIFPSFLWHKVEPITRGTRYSLVVWALGENWK
tara:strand:- start:55 stop:660 length:606 start_codon:yes stop_codon:yes gene_type:complete